GCRRVRSLSTTSERSGLKVKRGETKGEPPLHCPNCGGEYRDGFTECADCKVPLLELSPGEAPRRARLPMFPTIPRAPKPQDDRPRLVKAAPWFALFFGVFFSLRALGVLAGPIVSEERRRVLGVEA